MSESVDLVLFVCFFGALQGTLLGVSMLSVRADLAQRVLGLFLLGGAASMAVISLAHSGVVRELVVLQTIELTLIALMSPLLYFYVQLGAGRSTPHGFGLHFLPAAAWLFYLSVWALAWRSAGAPVPWWPRFDFVVAYQVAYTTLAAVTLWGLRTDGAVHRRVEPRKLFWMKALLCLMGVFHVAQLVRLVWTDVQVLRNVVPLVGALGFFVLTVVGFRHSPLFRSAQPARPPRDASSPRSREDLRRLEDLLTDERRFLDPELHLSGVATELGLSRSYLSRLINENLGYGFVELVQHYRVQEAQRLLKDPATEHLTIEAVATRSGFRSRSTFYQAFRKATGTTPSGFRKELHA